MSSLLRGAVENTTAIRFAAGTGYGILGGGEVRPMITFVKEGRRGEGSNGIRIGVMKSSQVRCEIGA